MNRAARREPIFGDDEHAGGFLDALAWVVKHREVEVHAYTLMPNHYHLLVRSVRGNLSAAMKDLGGRFTQEVNRLRRWDGPVFRGRYRSELIEDDPHLLTVAAYIHLNPIRARLARRLDQRCSTSHRGYLGLDVPPEWLSWELVTEIAGGREAFCEFVARLRTGGQPWPEGFDLDTGMTTPVHDDERQARARPLIRDRKGRPARPHEEVLSEVLQITGSDPRTLTRSARGRRGNPARRFALWALRQETDLTHVQIGRLLELSESHASHLLRRIRSRPPEPLAQWISEWERRRVTTA
ncbi:MAG: transposase [Deltaproteobacteria bacterium]|nr:transposase [Deltaproteobacteria bacterium]